MTERLSPGSGGPLVDPDGRPWTMTRRRLDLRMVRRALRVEGRLVLLGDGGGFSLRWVEPAERACLWDQVRRSYAGPGGDNPSGDYLAYEFADSHGRSLTYIELRC
jgi:hypothetical protein